MTTRNPYSFKVEPLKRSEGKSAVASAAYQSGEKLSDERTGRRCDWSRKKGVRHVEILTPPNSPGWAKNREALWNAVEAVEKRKDAQLARKFIISLPRQLTHEQRLKYTREFIQEQFVGRGMIVDLAVHDPEPKKNRDNYHLHLLVTLREIGPDGGFGKKNRDWNQVTLIEKWREQWAAHTNRALESAGFEPTWDHRSLEEQGIDRIPQVHLGQAVLEMEARGIQTRKGQRALEISRANSLLSELEEIEKEIYDERTRTDSKIAQPAAADRGPGATTPGRQPANYQAGKGGVGHGPRLKKAPSTTPAARSKKPNRPTLGPVNQPSQEGGQEMLSVAEQQEFVKVKKRIQELQRQVEEQAEEERRRFLSYEQRRRIDAMINREEVARQKRDDQLSLNDCFALDCLSELKRQGKTVEQVDWKEIESGVAAGMLISGEADAKDIAAVLLENGVSPAAEKKEAPKDSATPRDGQTAGERVAMEYLKTLAEVHPGLQGALEQAEKRQEDESRLAAATEEPAQKDSAAAPVVPRPGA